MSTISEWIAAHAVAFGAVKLKVQANGGWPDWVAEPHVVTRHIPGSYLSVSQAMGFGPERVAYELALGSTADFAALKALVGTRATLTLLDGTATTTGTPATIGGRAYLQIPNVLLLGIDAASVRRRTAGYVLCTAAFHR